MNKWLVALTGMLPTLIEIIDTYVVNVSSTTYAGVCPRGTLMRKDLRR
ncbi:MAG: hypothetical protein HY808_08925 [Nitrospirae bacterium]|nr:hypothetical protein [Nitrospirota bacterium]